MTINKTIAVLRGGLSSEKKVSNKTAKYVSTALKSLGYKILDVEVNDKFLYWAYKNKSHVDVFFNALHGTWGEDGKIQGVLEFLGVPYTHSGLTASAIGMDKDLSKKIFKNAGIKVPKGKILRKDDFIKRDPFTRPFIIKPIAEGSSFGVHIIKKQTNLKEILENIKDHEILAEEYIVGRDYTVALMNGKPLGILEIIPSESFFNYDAKYNNKKTVYRYPKETKSEILKKIIKFSITANQQIKATGITRVDFRVNRKEGIKGIFILEINTQPGLTKTSLVPKIARQSGISFEYLINWIVKDAKTNKN